MVKRDSIRHVQHTKQLIISLREVLQIRFHAGLTIATFAITGILQAR